MVLTEIAADYDQLINYDLDNIDKINDKKDLIKVIKKQRYHFYDLSLPST